MSKFGTKHLDMNCSINVYKQKNHVASKTCIKQGMSNPKTYLKHGITLVLAYTPVTLHIPHCSNMQNFAHKCILGEISSSRGYVVLQLHSKSTVTPQKGLRQKYQHKLPPFSLFKEKERDYRSNLCYRFDCFSLLIQVHFCPVRNGEKGKGEAGLEELAIQSQSSP